MRITTRENLKRLMAIVLFEKGKGEAISVATIQGEFGSRFQITGMFTPSETNNLALLIRAGALAAPMEIIEERTIGPSLGRDNIEKGFNATQWGFIAIVVFMSLYYVLFGVISSAWCVICAFVFLIFPTFNKIVNDWLFDTPMALFEMIVSFWLLFKGLRQPEAVEPHQYSHTI